MSTQEFPKVIDDAHAMMDAVNQILNLAMRLGEDDAAAASVLLMVASAICSPHDKRGFRELAEKSFETFAGTLKMERVQ